MRSETTTEAMATASAAVVLGVDATSIVHVLAADCARLLGACSAAVLVRVDGRTLEALASTSHVTDALELLELQARSGPCFDAVTSGGFVDLDRADVDARWPELGATMDALDVVGVHAAPMRWRGRTVGAFTVMWGPEPASPGAERAVQAFADVATIALLQDPAPVDDEALTGRLAGALERRVPIERAKGLLAQREELDVASAFDLLVARSEDAGEPLTRTAERVLDEWRA